MVQLDCKRWKEKIEFPVAMCTSHKATVQVFFSPLWNCFLKYDIIKDFLVMRHSE